jgi:hypothetical protein
VPRVILQHVPDRVERLARAGERTDVVTVAVDAATPLHEPVERTGEPDAEALHAPRERAVVACLGDQVKVVPLHGEVNHPQLPEAALERERAPHAREAALAPQVPHVSREADGDVDRLPSAVEPGAPHVWLPLGTARTPRAEAASAVAQLLDRAREGERELTRAPCHLDSAYIVKSAPQGPTPNTITPGRPECLRLHERGLLRARGRAGTQRFAKVHDAVRRIAGGAKEVGGRAKCARARASEG